MLRRTFLHASAAAAAILGLRGRRVLAAKNKTMPNDPMLAPWAGPHGGYPPFDKIKPADIKPALMKGMELQRAEIAAVVAHKGAATFENTIQALEDSGR